MRNLGDVTRISGYNAPVVDVVIGGSPCQDLSVAGNRSGLDGERSGLYMEQIRIIKEMRKKDAESGRTGKEIRPRYMVWENVPGAFSCRRGDDFAAVLEEAVRVIESPPLFLCLKKDGQPADACMEWTEDGALRGEFSMLSFGECPSVAVESHLYAILEECPPQKYYLSERACSGILNRAKKNGKELPGDLVAILTKQAMLA